MKNHSAKFTLLVGCLKNGLFAHAGSKSAEKQSAAPFLSVVTVGKNFQSPATDAAVAGAYTFSSSWVEKSDCCANLGHRRKGD
jgi:hypothetical protein